MRDSRFGLVKAPKYVGWVRYPHRGWMAVASDDGPKQTAKMADERSHGNFWAVLEMGVIPDDDMLPDEFKPKRQERNGHG